MLTVAAAAAAAVPCAAQDPGALARAGTAAIEARRFGDALEAFTAASRMRPDEASHCFGAGIAAFMLGRDNLAQASFECALTLKPGYLAAAEWLGDLHYRAGRLAEAIAIYEAAQERSGTHELQWQLAHWRKEQALHRRFREVRTEHFTALFEADADEPLARDVMDRLEAAYSRIGGALGVYPSNPITVVIYTREQFADVTRMAEWAAGAYDGRIRLPLAGAVKEGDELDRVLSHEYVHALVATLGGRAVPAWINEGIATVLEPAGSQQVESTLARTRARPRLSQLHRGFARFSRSDADIAYASAARAVRRLIERRGVAALVALLRDLSQGAPFARAFHERMAMRYEAFARSVARE